MYILHQKFHFPIEVVVNSLETQKGLELVFRPHFLQIFLMKLFLLEYDITGQISLTDPHYFQVIQ